jgi:uncharacterized protein (TIGR03083 family)
MTRPRTAIDRIPDIGHDAAMDLAATEYDRVLALADDLAGAEWSRPTDCVDWDVKDVLGHLLGMFELLADEDEQTRQVSAAADLAAASDGVPLHEMTALQVREHSYLTPEELTQALHNAAPRALAARRATTADQRAATYLSELPGEEPWTVGFLLDIIHTRDPWMHRVDICRATGRAVELSAEHDGRIVGDVVSDWARRHGRPFTLALTGAAGRTYGNGSGGPEITLEGVEFCRTVSGREIGEGLLRTEVPF